MAIPAKVSSRLFAGLTLLTTMLLVGSASAFELNVNSTADAIDGNPGDGICASPTGECTLRAAIQEANAHPGRDKVILGSGHFLLSIPGAGEDGGMTGDLDVRDPLLITGAGMGVTVIDGNRLDSVLHVVEEVSNDNSIALEDLTLRGGSSGGVRVGWGYSGISVFERVDIRENTGPAIEAAAQCILLDAWIRDNDTAGQFALELSVTGSRIERSTVANNSGGGIHAFYAYLALIDSVVRDNGGIAVHFREEGGQVLNSVIERNGAGLVFGSDTFSSVAGSTIRDNVGRGIAMGCGSQCYVDVFNTTVSGNWGGGIAAYCGGLVLHNSTISGNSASRGGGIRLYDSSGCGDTTVSGSYLTVTNNSADEGGGIAVDGGADPNLASLNLGASIIAGNHALVDRDCSVSGNALITGGSNVVGVGSGCSWSPANGNVVGSNENPVNPLLGELADNGGPTLTHALMPDSPAKDVLGYCTGGADQRGVARPQGNGCDIGSFESNACSNGIDDDGDGLIDHPADPGCKDVLASREHALCQDGQHNDGDNLMDFDGGASWNGGVPITAPDPHCIGKPYRNNEKACGLGFEVAPALVLSAALGGRRHRSRRLASSGSRLRPPT